MALGKAQVNIMANLKPLQRGLASAKAGVMGFVKTSGSLMRKGFTSAFRVVQSGLRKIINLAKLAAVAMVGIGAASIKIATDVEETENLFNIAMGSMVDEARNFAREYSKSLGLFENDTRKALSTFQLMLTSMGIAEEEAFGMSKQLTMLTNDIASFRNQRPEEIFNKLAAGITGETEPLKRLGILVNDTVIKQMAMEDATLKNVKALSETQKVMLRYQAIVNATQKDQGDMARTLDSTANVMRTIRAQLKRTGVTIGQVFIEDFTKAARNVRDFFLNNQDQIREWAKAVKDSINDVIERIKVYIDLAKEGNFEAIFKDLGNVFSKLLEGFQGFFETLKPIAVDIGKQIGNGFWDAVKDTGFGEFLRRASMVTEAVTLPTRLNLKSLVGASRLFTSDMTNELNLAERRRAIDRRMGSMDRPENEQIVSELRKLNQTVSEQTRME